MFFEFVSPTSDTSAHRLSVKRSHVSKRSGARVCLYSLQICIVVQVTDNNRQLIAISLKIGAVVSSNVKYLGCVAVLMCL